MKMYNVYTMYIVHCIPSTTTLYAQLHIQIHYNYSYKDWTLNNVYFTMYNVQCTLYYHVVLWIIINYYLVAKCKYINTVAVNCTGPNPLWNKYDISTLESFPVNSGHEFQVTCGNDAGSPSRQVKCLRNTNFEALENGEEVVCPMNRGYHLFYI